jgi:hypothetical protein
MWQAWPTSDDINSREVHTGTQPRHPAPHLLLLLRSHLSHVPWQVENDVARREAVRGVEAALDELRSAFDTVRSEMKDRAASDEGAGMGAVAADLQARLEEMSAKLNSAVAPQVGRYGAVQLRTLKLKYITDLQARLEEMSAKLNSVVAPQVSVTAVRCGAVANSEVTVRLHFIGHQYDDTAGRAMRVRPLVSYT